MQVEPWLGEHEARDGYELVVLPTAAELGYASAGEPAQVVVSRGLIDRLEPDELDAVVAHEVCHLRHRHDRYLALAASIRAGTLGLPTGRRSADALRVAVERWADETAAATPARRAAVRRALVKCSAGAPVAVPAFTGGAAVAERLAALDAAPPTAAWRVRIPVFTPAIALSLVVVTVGLAWVASGHHGVLGLLGYCPL